MTRGQLAESGCCFLPVGAPGTHDMGRPAGEVGSEAPRKNQPPFGCQLREKGQGEKNVPRGGQGLCLSDLALEELRKDRQ